MYRSAIYRPSQYLSQYLPRCNIKKNEFPISYKLWVTLSLSAVILTPNTSIGIVDIL